MIGVAEPRAPVPIEADAMVADRGIRVSLLGKFEVLADRAPVRTQPCTRRLLAFMALQERPVTRYHLTATLWPDTDEGKAAANLRSTLWRLGGRDGPFLSTLDDALTLEDGVEVDVAELRCLTDRLLGGDAAPVDVRASMQLLEKELLPGWCDEWVLVERERLRLLQLHALERLAGDLLGVRDFVHALECCLTLVRMEPFRESAHRLLIATHVAEGNLAHALQHYNAFRDLLWQELRLHPSPQMEALMASEVDVVVPVPGGPRQIRDVVVTGSVDDVGHGTRRR